LETTFEPEKNQPDMKRENHLKPRLQSFGFKTFKTAGMDMAPMKKYTKDNHLVDEIPGNHLYHRDFSTFKRCCQRSPDVLHASMPNHSP